MVETMRKHAGPRIWDRLVGPIGQTQELLLVVRQKVQVIQWCSLHVRVTSLSCSSSFGILPNW